MNKWGIGLVLFLIAASSAVAQPSRGQLVDNIVARVDNYILLRSELEEAYRGYLSRGNAQSEEAKCNILQTLVLNKLMVAKAEIDSVIVPEDQIQSQLDYSLSVALQNFPSEEEFIQAYGKTIEEFREELYDDMKENLTVNEMQRTITDGITVTPREVKRFYNRIPKDSLPFFNTEIIVGQFVRKPSTSDAELTRIKNRMLEWKRQIEAGEIAFEDLAKQHSEDPGSGKRGGNLGFVNRGDLVPEYEETALGLAPNQISEPVQSQFGFHMIQLLERRGNQYNSRHILIKPQSGQSEMQNAIQYLDSVRTLILTDTTVSFERLAKEHSEDMLTASNGGYFTNQNAGGLRVTAKDIDPTVFFTIDTMQVGTFSPPIPFEMQGGEPAARIIYYKDRIPPHLANLEDDYQKIKSAVLQSKQNDAMFDWFDKAQSDVYIYVDPEFSNCRILN